MAGFTALVYGITLAGQKGWTDPTGIEFLVAGGVLLAAFVVNELLVSDPVMAVRLFLNRPFTMSNILMWVVSALLFVSSIRLPAFFANVQRRPPLNTSDI